MRNLIYLNGDGMTNVAPDINTVQINDFWYCEMNEEKLNEYLDKHGLVVIAGDLLDMDDLHKYGTVLVLK